MQYIDGFSGPGEYAGGEPGSPILALNTVADHRTIDDFIQARKQIDFLFVEEQQTFVDSLRRKVDEKQWPSAFNIDIKQGQFERILTDLLNEVDRGNRLMPPTLLFIDPFGSSGFSMELLARFSKYARIDMLINFNYLDLNRWLLPDSSKHITLDRLYGSPRWRPALNLDGEGRRDFLIQEYSIALREAGWRSTNFEMINNQNQTQYYLFFGTRSPRGMQVIKGAMRSVSPDGLFRYSDRTDPSQPRLVGMGMEDEYARELADHLFTRYQGQEVTKESLIENDIAWHPRWISRDLTAALRLLERSNPSMIRGVRNFDGHRRQANSFPDGCIISFTDYFATPLF